MCSITSVSFLYTAPPMMPNAPTLDEIASSSVLVRWQKWTSSYGGDGPVIKYIVKYRTATLDEDAPYPHMVEQTDGRENYKTVTDLEADTYYDFVVIAVREGERGDGPPSPKATDTTLCDSEYSIGYTRCAKKVVCYSFIPRM